MRAIFVLGVVAFHLWGDAEHWSVDPGSVGVVGFFALSGYLITGLLIKEHDTTGRVHMPHFYGRRVLRLFPALCFLLGVWFLADLLFQSGQFLSTVPSAHSSGSPVSWITGLEGVGAALFYVTNWLNVEPHWQLWYGYSPISHLWTLAVEEQFYLIWAPVMLLLLRLRRYAATFLAAAIAVIALAEPVFLSSSGFNRVYFGTDTRCAALFCGALCAFIGSTYGWGFLRTSQWAPLLGASILAAIWWSAYALRQEGDRGLWNTGLVVCTLSCALGVVFIVERAQGVAGRLLSSALLVAIGKRSYAIYLWSYVLNTWLRDTGFFESFLVIGLTFVAAEISYRFVELPALRYKRYFTTASPPEHKGTKSREKVLALA
jgi:peptidoglycan/LPS O-acetylase OafA/YrhL